MAQQEVKAIFSADTSGITSGAKVAADSIKGFNKSAQTGMGQTDQKTNTLGSSIKNIAVGVGAVAAVTAAIGVLKGSVGNAVARFDTLNAYPKVMKQMGYSTGDVTKSVGILKKGVDGLPTSLQDLTKSAQSFAILTKSATTGAKTATALNDAFLASGASAGDASRGVEQYSQMLSSGQVDLMSWRTLQETMPYALTQVAKSFGLTGKSAERDLYAKLKSGDITMDQLNKRFMELDGGVNGFANTARTATGGIGTSFTNMRNAVTNGLANTITAIDNGLKNAGVKNGIAGLFNQAKQVIINSFAVINSVVQSAIPPLISAFQSIMKAVKPVFDFISSHSDIFSSIAVGIAVAVGAYKAYTTAVNIAKGAMVIFNAVMALNPFTVIILAVTAVVAALVYFFTQTKTGKKLWSDFTKWLGDIWNGLVDTVKSVGQSISDAWDATVQSVKNVWNGIGDFFSGLWNGIVDGITGAWDGVVGFFTGIWNGIISALQPVFSMLTDGWNNAVTNLTGIWNGIVDVATGIWNLLKDAIMGPILLVLDLITGDFKQLGTDAENIWNDIVNNLGIIWDGIVSIATGIFTNIINGIITIWQTLSTWTVNMWNGLVSGVVNIWNGFINGAVSFGNGLWNGIKNVWNAIPGFVSGLWNGVKNTVVNLWNGIVNGVVNGARNAWNGLVGAWNGVIGWVRGLWNGVKSAVQGAMNFNLWDAGSAILSSLWNGMLSVWSNVKKWVGGIASWIRDHKGPISYDRKLLIPAGQAIMGGFNQSLQSSFEDVKDTVNGVAPYIQNALSGSSDYMINTRLADNMQLSDGTLSVDMNKNAQPAQINLNMGGSQWNAYVNDISNTQGNNAQLKKNNSVYL